MEKPKEVLQTCILKAELKRIMEETGYCPIDFLDIIEVKLNKSDVGVTVCNCEKPVLISTVHPLPDICYYCRKQIIQTEH